jgi:hypothetical protein
MDTGAMTRPSAFELSAIPRLVRMITVSLLAVSLAAGCGEERGVPPPEPQAVFFDITSSSRVTATDTYRSFLGLWPRETDDAPYTIRDRDVGTSWKVPLSGTHTLTIDCAPFLESPPAVSWLDPVWGEPPRTPVRLRVKDFCGGTVLFQDDWEEPARPYLLDHPRPAYCLELEVQGNPDHVRLSELRVYAVKAPEQSSPVRGTTAERLPNLSPPRNQTTAQSGVVEGFYGRPWCHAERSAMIERLSQVGLGLYIYAPKNDPLHRDMWRIPYERPFVELLCQLREEAYRRGVTLSFGISPGKDMATEDERERGLLVAKITPFLDCGFRHVTLLFDDIETSVGLPIDGRLGRAHAELANWLKNELDGLARTEVALWFVPTVYSSERQHTWPGGQEYLDALRALDPRIQVMWTGTRTLSSTLSAADLTEVTERIGRKPVLWDNEHATDGGDAFVGKVYLAPYTRRSADLVGAVQGVVANPMILGAANRLVVPTYASFLADPAHYVPDEATARAVLLEAPTAHDRSLLEYLCATFYGSGVQGFPGITFPRNLPMESAIDAFRRALAAGAIETVIAAGSNLLEVAAHMATVQTSLYHSRIDAALVDDLWVPADRLRHEGYALLWLLAWVGSALAGTPDDELRLRADAYLNEALLDRYQLSLFRVNGLRDYLVRHQPTCLGFQRPQILEPQATARVGTPWVYTPSPGAAVTVSGLPGSAIEAGTVVWTPSHPGIYEAVVIATTERGWAWRQFRLVVGTD